MPFISCCSWALPVRRVRRAKNRFVLLVLAWVLTSTAASLPGATLPAGFSEIEIPDTWDEYAGVTFDEVGAVYVWERSGRIWLLENDAKVSPPLLDISAEVGAWDDHGLLGVAFHPNFRQNGYIYLLYVVDHHYLAKFGTPSYNPSANEYQQATIGRITRYTARASDNFRSVDPASRLVLVGETASTGFPILFYTHGVGTLLFGTDGTLLASCGDGGELSDGGSDPASYYAAGLSEGIIRPKENIGAFRAQLVDSLNGKIIRLDPLTGNGVPSNPFYEPANPRAARSRVYALGLRNPFRMTFRPGTGSHLQSDGFPGVIYLGDVGYFTWEELSVVTAPGQNFGWPLFEGFTPPVTYLDMNPANLDAPNPLFGSGGCTQQYFTFRDLLQEATLGPLSWPNLCNSGQQVPDAVPHFVHRRPAADWQHGTGPSRVGIFSGTTASTINIGASGSPVPGPQFGGNCSIGGTWYTGTVFPTNYQNTYFHGDLGNGWIKSFQFDSNNTLVRVQDFANNAGAVVGIAAHPTNGSLYYIPWTSNIRKVQYTGSGNRPPIPVATANVTYGPGPLTVQFNGAGSFDPDGQALTYRWDFGDGSPLSTAANPTHTFSASNGVPTRYVVTLTVSDGAASATTVSVYTDMEAGNNGDLITTSFLQNATKGTAGSWSIQPSPLTQFTVSTDFDPRFPSVVLCNGTNYSDTSSTRSFKIRNTVETQWCTYRLNTATSKLSAGCFVRLGDFQGTTFAYYDIFAIEADSTEYSVLSFVDGGGPGLIFQEHTSAGVGSPITVAANTTYWITMLWDRTASLATLKIYNPTTWALLGTSTKAIPNGATDIARSVFLGRYDAHLRNGANSTNAIYYDDLMLDITGAQFPLLPNTNSVGVSTSLVISVNNTPPTVAIVSPAAGTLYSVSSQTTVNLSATVTDNEHSLAQLSPQWQTVLHHNNHVHTNPFDTNWVTTATLAPLGCDGDSYFYRITLTVTDAAGLTGSAFVDLYPNCTGNTPPTLSPLTNQTMAVNSVLGPLPITVNDAETTADNLTLTAVSANPLLVPDGNVTFGGSGSARTMTVTPVAGQSGTAQLTVSVSDGELAASASFLLTVSPPNNTAPTISDILNQSVVEDASTGPLSFTVSDAQSPASSLLVTASSSNPTLVPNANLVLAGSGAFRSVTVTPAPNQFGTATITVLVSDGLLSSSDPFVVTVNPVNDPPTLSDLTDQVINQDTSTGPLSFVIGDVETTPASLSVSGTSSNPILVPNANIVFGGSGANRTVTITPAPGQFGTAVITVTVSDGSLTASDTLNLTVSAVTAPTYLFSESFEGTGFENTGWIKHGSPNPDYTTLALQGAQSLNCSGAQYVERPFSFNNSFYLYFQARWNTWGNFNNIIYWDDSNYNIVLGLYADSSRAEIQHGSASQFGTTALKSGVTYHMWVEWTKGTGANGTFKLFVSTNGIKPTVADASVSNGNGGAPARIYIGPTSSGPNAIFDRVFVDDVPIGNNPGSAPSTNQPPTISGMANQTINEDSATSALSFSVSDAETPAANLVVTAGSSNPTLVPNANIALGGSGALRTLTVTPAANQSGSATITLAVSDGVLSSSNAFVLVVTPVNDPPTISDLTDRTVNEDTPTPALAFTVSDLETPAGSLNVTGNSSNPALVPNANLVFGGSGNNRTLTVTPAANQSGTATITVTVSDGGLSASDTFVLTVTPVNDAPTLSVFTDRTISMDTTLGPLDFMVGDVDSDPNTLLVSAVSSDQAVVRDADIALGGLGTNRTLTLLPASNAVGTATITISVDDGLLTNRSSFVVRVLGTNSNTPPTLSAPTDQSMAEDGTLGPLPFTIGDAQSPPDALQVTVSSSNAGLFPPGSMVLGGNGANRTLTLAPLANQSGSATITLTVSDGTLTSSNTFVLVVNPVNDPPSISDIANQTLSGPSTGPLPFTVSDLETPADNLTVSAISSNPALVPGTNIVFAGTGMNRTVTVTPLAGQTGTATVTVTVSDGGLAASDNFVVTVSGPAPSYLLVEGFDATGFDNTGWTKHGTPNADYTALVLDGTQSLNCSGVQYVERPFNYGTNFNLYLRVRWITWRNGRFVMYWDDPNFNVIGSLYTERSRMEINHGSVSALGTTVLGVNVTYHVWVEWTQGSGANGTMKLFISTTGVKPASPEANITTGTGKAPARFYLGPTQSGPNVIFDRVRVDDVPIGSNP
jgi:glucose/arabinose dehydrogenase